MKKFVFIYVLVACLSSGFVLYTIKLKTGFSIVKPDDIDSIIVDMDDDRSSEVSFFYGIDKIVFRCGIENCDSTCFSDKMLGRKRLMLMEGVKIIEWIKESNCRYKVIYQVPKKEKQYFYNIKYDKYLISISGSESDKSEMNARQILKLLSVH